MDPPQSSPPSSTPPQPTGTASPFLSLPRELRDQIYTLILHSPYPSLYSAAAEQSTDQYLQDQRAFHSWMRAPDPSRRSRSRFYWLDSFPESLMLVCRQLGAEAADAVGRASPAEVYLHTYGGDESGSVARKSMRFRSIIARKGKKEDEDVTAPFYGSEPGDSGGGGGGVGFGSTLGPAMRRCRVEVFDSPFTRPARGDRTSVTPAETLRKIVAVLVQEILRSCIEMRDLEVWLWVRWGTIAMAIASDDNATVKPAEVDDTFIVAASSTHTTPMATAEKGKEDMSAKSTAAEDVMATTEEVLLPLTHLPGFKGVILREVYDQVGYKHGRNAAMRLQHDDDGGGEEDGDGGRGGWRYESAEQGRITSLEARWLEERGLREYVVEKIDGGFARMAPEIVGELGGGV
ncbi:hypothetical protein LTS18_009913 [Coniosporium uncinatum]|uniref:Uncharacterized protein n=1 Tax=Coniosporium uncinatum TaxID=93489 RepID=A0ACC3DA79_9PEZI|nr:hypothetical protein LTS18_009913 [Coniosporium uncinatum]